jgi:NADH-quinone oxidoreductase subunit C/D
MGIFESLKARFGEAIGDAREFRGEETIYVSKEYLKNICLWLRDVKGFNFLVDLCGVDRGVGKTDRFEVVYLLRNMDTREQVRLKVRIRDGERVDTVSDVWPTANWHEREVYDMFGIEFEGHPNLERLYLPDDYEGFPLRKDYPVRGDTNRIFYEGGAKTKYKPKRNDTTILNMGPQHPSTHGVLRVILELEGETIVDACPIVGYLHRGTEKLAEQKTYFQVLPLTDRLDYLAPPSNNLAYILAVEKLLGIEPPARAKYIRVIMTELARIASHLIWLGTHAMDIGAATVFLYTFREREYIYELWEMVAGARFHQSYFRIGGVKEDLPEEFIPALKKFVDTFPRKIDEYEGLLTNNKIWRVRTEGVAVLSKEDAIRYGVTGPILRGSGVKWDLRKAYPYSGYEEFRFEIPVGEVGDTFSRYLVRLEEMRQSREILKQAVEKLPDGPIKFEPGKYSFPDPEEVKGSRANIEALIHQFKQVIEGVKPPVGEVYQAVEAPKGELGFYIVSDGSEKPYRMRIRSPSLINLQALPLLVRGHKVADVVTAIGSIDIVLGEVDK